MTNYNYRVLWKRVVSGYGSAHVAYEPAEFFSNIVSAKKRYEELCQGQGVPDLVKVDRMSVELSRVPVSAWDRIL